MEVTLCYKNECKRQSKFNKRKEALLLRRTINTLHSRGGKNQYMIDISNDWFAIIPSKKLNIKNYRIYWENKLK